MRKRRKLVERFSVTHYTIERFLEGETDFPRILGNTSLVITSDPHIDFPRFTEEMREMLECISQMKVSFDDLEQRQIIFVRVKNLLQNIRSRITFSSPGFLRTINMCLDAVDNTKSELLSLEQLEALEFVFQTIDERIDENRANQLEEILLNSGLKPVPKLEGIADLYT